MWNCGRFGDFGRVGDVDTDGLAVWKRCGPHMNLKTVFSGIS